MAIDQRNIDRERSIRDYKKSGVVKAVEILANKDACDACVKRNGEVIDLSDIPKNPLPTEGCVGGHGCRCAVLPVIEEL